MVEGINDCSNCGSETNDVYVRIENLILCLECFNSCKIRMMKIEIKEKSKFDLLLKQLQICRKCSDYLICDDKLVVGCKGLNCKENDKNE